MSQNASVPKPITIALADDHDLFRQGLCSLIDSFENYKVVIQAAGGAELIKLLSNAKPLPDICIIDINMPKMNGFQTLSALKKKWPALKVIILSMINEEYTVLKMLKSGANGYLLKSGDYPQLKKAIAEVHLNGFYYSNTIAENKMSKLQDTEIPDLTKRELEFLGYCISDMPYSEIAEQLHISIRTVEGIKERLSEKLHISSRIGLAVFAIKTGLINIQS
jgi:two-component system invasion response regulator UvrY